MNAGKLGRPFEFPNSYISFLAFMKVEFDIPYRTVEGIVRELSEYVRFVEEMHYTQMRRRVLASMKGKKPSELVGRRRRRAHGRDRGLVGPIRVEQGLLHRGQVEEGE